MWVLIAASTNHPLCLFQGKAKSKAKAGDNEMATVFTEMVINVLAPTTKTSSTGTMSSGKVAELRSKYLQQMRELHQLFEGAV